LLRNDSLFLGTVTDAGPNLADFVKLFQRKFTRKEIEGFEKSLDITTAKKVYKRLLPKSAHFRLKNISTEEQLEMLVKEFFPALQLDKERPVTFTVHETFRGTASNSHTVWTSQGNGDCGYPFERGKSYLVPTSIDDKTGHKTTSLCLGILPAEKATAELNFLRSKTRPIP